MPRFFSTPIAFALGTLLFVAAAGGADAERFPYSAFVAQTAAPVRSGPGETFYPVLNLNVGDAVEVWRHDAGDWCAIRPPEGTFSWVAAEFVATADGRTGTVIGREVNARVGTRFSDLRDAVQVRLDEGEQVDLLGEQTLTAADGRTTKWYKILPPAGEFRWIEQRHLVTHPDRIPAAAAPPNETARPVGFDESAAARLDALGDDAPADAVLGEMEFILSQMITVEPTAWNFDALEHRAEALVERAESALERSKARLFLGKLARLRDIHRRYAAVAQIRSETAAVDRRLAESAPPVVPKTALDGSTDVSRYDGVGRLTQIVLRSTADGAAYALTDERGDISVYVAAAPGVNLRQYAGLDVGINGIRGTSGEKSIPLITAKRIDVLSSRAVAAASRERSTR